MNCWIERNANINIFELLSKYSYLLADHNNERDSLLTQCLAITPGGLRRLRLCPGLLDTTDTRAPVIQEEEQVTLVYDWSVELMVGFRWFSSCPGAQSPGP